MSDDISFLFTIWYAASQRTIKCAVKFKKDSMPEKFDELAMNPKFKDFVDGLLPMHFKNCGEVTAIERIIDVVDLSRT